MSDSNSASPPSAPRATLKLKGAARKVSPPAKPAQAQPARQTPQKLGAAWSDEYKERMQADMDALVKR